MGTDPLPDSAATGFAKSALYDKHRPSYPPAAVEPLLAGLNVKNVPGARVVDLGAGTGKFTEILAGRMEEYDILAIEPHGLMRQELERKGLNRVDVQDGRATDIPVDNGSVDAVIAAQALHWFATVETLQEIHRVLKPGGSLGAIWNVEDYNQAQSHTPSTSWEAKLKELVWTREDNQPRFRHAKWKDAFEAKAKDGSSASDLFSLPLHESKLEWTVWLSKENIWHRYRTLSQIAIFEGQELENARAIFDSAMESRDVEVNENGDIALHGTTVWAFVAKK